ncbi:peptidase [Trinickia caryophylli]|nr:peptidase [Trinickia caryophylli]
MPQLDGTRTVPSLGASVGIERDAQGVATLSGTSREDLAYATGFVHAQDRFFQMDLLRRSAAGELAGLIGPAAVSLDESHRIHRFRARAHDAVAALPADERRLLERYVAGVNDGLDALTVRPFEYMLLGERPKPWSSEDSLLAVYAMYFDLQYGELRRILAREALRERVSPDLLAFLLPTSSHWDALLDVASIPAVAAPPSPAAPDWLDGAHARTPQTMVSDWQAWGAANAMTGSNAWAVDGAHAHAQRAMVANDMHLSLRLPNVWYRLSLVQRSKAGVERRFTGVTLPGAPTIVAGSNGRVAWGFTNSYGHYMDLVELERDSRDANRYRVPGGAWERARITHERIDVRGEKAVTLEVAETRWGPVTNAGTKAYAIRWTAHDANAVNLRLRQMEDVRTVREALAVAQTMGIPTQNMLVADADGHIGWTLAGPLPRHEPMPFAGQTPPLPDLPWRSSTYAGWRGYLAPPDYPALVDPPSGRLWNANNRQLAGADQAKIGDGGADVGARATQIRDDLLARQSAVPHDLLAVQTDDRALWVEPWRQLAQTALDGAALDGHPDRARFKQILSAWNGRADADAAGYALARAFFDSMYSAWFAPLDAALGQTQAGLTYAVANSRRLAVMESLARYEAWVPPGYADWHAFVLARIDDAIEQAKAIDGASGSLDHAVWGERNRAAIAHPFERLIPPALASLRTLLAAPADPLSGDFNMPRVQGASFGASERMVVSPGHEDEGIFHMPGGQSGNPASPYFLAGHEAWVRGESAPFLPGPARHKLTLRP